jgi:hypothetical protein
MRRLMHSMQRRLIRPTPLGEPNLRPQSHPQHRHPPLTILPHDPHRPIDITINHKPTPGSDRKKPKHMAARQRSHKRLLRIDRPRIGPGNRHNMRRRRRGHLSPTIEQPDMPTAIPLIDKRPRVTLPAYFHAVLTHAVLLAKRRSCQKSFRVMEGKASTAAVGRRCSPPTSEPVRPVVAPMAPTPT